MELELKHASLDAYETGGEVTLTQEETAETIVPDYCPDIARIIATEGTVYLHNREPREGRMSGTVRVTLLYTPEGEGGIRSLEFAMPFTVEGGAPEGDILLAESGTEFLETRLLNPRKVFTHCKLATRLTAFRRQVTSYATGAEAEEGLCVERRREAQHAVVLTQIAERDFTFTDTMTLSPGRPGVAELLSSRVTHTVTEEKIIGSKLIFKGVFTVSLLYRTEDGGCCSASGELPFSQILEVEGAPEDAAASVSIQLTGADIQPERDDPEGREISVTLYLHATALLRQERELELLCDLYSTAYEARYEAAPLALTGFFQAQRRRQTVREVLETGVAAESLLSLCAVCGAVSVSREGSVCVLRTAAAVRVLYLDEGGTPLAVERRIDVSCQLELPEGCKVTARAECPEEVQGSLGDRGIEVRFPVDFLLEAAGQVKKVCVTSAKVDTEAPKDVSGAPSLILRCLGRDETAWDLAKACNTTIPDILAANQLTEEGELPREKLLLIPRKRT